MSCQTAQVRMHLSLASTLVFNLLGAGLSDQCPMSSQMSLADKITIVALLAFCKFFIIGSFNF